jgi:hypothetical protein
MKFSAGDRVRAKTTVYGNYLPNLEGYIVCATKGSTAHVVEDLGDHLVRIRFDAVEPLDPAEWEAQDGTPYRICEAGKDQILLKMNLDPIQ